MAAPLFGACQAAVTDSFINTHYFSGSGSLANLDKEASNIFEEGLRKIAADRPNPSLPFVPPRQ